MSNQNLKVLVYGATGSQSSPVVWSLLERGHTPYVLTRNPDKASAMRDAGAEVVAGDMVDAARLRELSQGMDAVSLQIPFFLPNPADAPSYARNAIDAAREAGVKLIVWNTSGPVPPERTGNPGVDVRVEVADYLRISDVPHIIIAPTAYMENFLGPWTAPFVANEDRVAYPNPESVRVGWIASADVGALMVAALERPELAPALFQVSGLENPDGTELAQAFSEGLRRPIRYYAMPPHDFGAILDGMFGPGAGDGAAEQYQQAWDNPDHVPPMHFSMKLVLDKLPVEMTSVAKWAAQHKAAFVPKQNAGQGTEDRG